MEEIKIGPGKAPAHVVTEKADMLRPRVVDLPLHVDDRGWLFEGVHNFELPQDLRFSPFDPDPPQPGPNVYPPRFGQVYLVHSRTRGTVRAFHRHQVLWDYFVPGAGAAKFVVWSGKIGHEALYAEVDERLDVILTVEAPKLLIVPPGWYHGWMALTDGTTIVSVGSELYDREKPDEERIPFDILGPEIWQVQNR